MGLTILASQASLTYVDLGWSVSFLWTAGPPEGGLERFMGRLPNNDAVRSLPSAYFYLC